MLAQALTVISGEYNQRSVEKISLFEERYQAPHLCVSEGDLAIIGLAAIPAGIRLRRRIGKMRIVEVDPKQKRPMRIALQPAQRLFHHHVAAALHQVQVGLVKAVEVKVVEIGIKTFVEAEAGVQNSGANKGCSRVTVIMQDLGQGD